MSTRRTNGERYVATRAAWAALPSAELLSRYLETRDDGAFRELVDRYAGLVGRVCRAVLGRDDLARDAFQETFLRLVRHGHAVRRRDGLAGWLARVARTTALNLRRREARHRRHAMATADARPASRDPLPADEAAALRAALAALPDRFRLPLELVYLDGLTHAEAARRLDQPKGTVDANVSRGLTKLRAALSAKAGVALGVALPSAARAVPPEWVDATVRAAAAVVPRPAGLAGSLAAWWATRPVASVAWAGAAALAACGAVGAALVATPQPPPEPAPPAPTTPPAADPEPLEVRNKRVLEADILPKVTAALKPLALNGGDVVVTRVEAHDFRARLDVELKHRDAPPEVRPTRLKLFLDTRQGTTTVLFDLTGGGEFRPMNLNRPIILAEIPALGIQWDLRSQPLDAALAELKRFPPDPRAFGRAALHAVSVRVALAPYRGQWLYRGDPAARNAFAPTLPVGPDDPVEIATAGGGQFTVHATEFVVEPDGRLRRWLTDHTYSLTADGQRLEVAGTDQWWVRAE